MAMFTLPQMIARLTKGFVKVTGRTPDGLEKIKIKQEALERIKQQNKVLDMEGNVLDVTKPIIGGKQEGLERVAKTLEANQKRKLNTFKNLDDNKKLNADEIEELEVELGNVNDPDGPDLYEAYPEFDGTAGSAKKILKDSVEYEQSMFDQYKKEKSAGQGQFTKAQVLIERLKNTIKENPNDKYVQETFPNFIKEIENNPKLADDPNVQEAFGITDLSETTDQRLVEYPDGTLDFYTKGGQGGLTTGMDSVQSLMDELGISQEEALRIKQLEPEDQILEITKLRTLKDKPKKAQGGIVGLYI